MRISKFLTKLTLIVLLVSAVFSSIFMFGTDICAQANVKLVPMPEIKSESAVLYVLNTKTEIISQNNTLKKYPVSLTKMITAILAIEYADTAADFVPQKSEKVTIGYEVYAIRDKGEEYNSVGFKPGDKVSLSDLITAMIVCDADDAALAIAVYIGRKIMGGVKDSYQKYDKDAIEYFVNLMNHRASILGLANTHFTTCAGEKSGYQSFSTVSDMARISAEYMKYGFLKEISRLSSKQYQLPSLPNQSDPPKENDGEEDDTSDEIGENDDEKDDISNEVDENGDEKNDEFEDEISVQSQDTANGLWINQNELINSESEYFYSDCKGLMAGYGTRTHLVENFNQTTHMEYTTEDYAYISAFAEHNGIQVIAVVMGENSSDAFEDIRNMFDYAFNNYVLHTYTEQNQTVAKYQIKNAMDPSNSYLEVIADRGGEYLSRIDELYLFNHVIRMNGSYFVPKEDNVYETYISPPAGIVKGTVVGTMDIYYNSVYIDTVQLYAANTVQKYEPLPQQKQSSWFMRVDWASGVYTVLIVAIIVFILILTISIMNNIKKQYRARKRYLGTKRKNASRYYGKKKYR